MSHDEDVRTVPRRRVELGAMIRERRRHLCMRQEDLAVRSKYSRAAISLIESGKQGLTMEGAAELLDALGWVLTVSNAETWREDRIRHLMDSDASDAKVGRVLRSLLGRGGGQ